MVMPMAREPREAQESPSRANRRAQLIETRGNDAQAYYSSGFCVFVANLSQSETDEDLEAAVTNAFSKYGTVFVKIRRDNRKQMPYGFAQFTNAQHARRALIDGKGTMILGRACRTERVKGNCQFVVYRRDESVMTGAEVAGLMEIQGDVARVEPLHAQTQALTNLPETAWLVTFDRFDPRRDVVGALASHTTYICRPFAQRETRETPDRAAGSGAHRAVIVNSNDLSQRSVFIANLPPNVSELAIRGMTSDFGRILNIEIHRQTNQGRPRSFAFVEFDQSDVPDSVINQLPNGPNEVPASSVPPIVVAHRTIGNITQQVYRDNTGVHSVTRVRIPQQTPNRRTQAQEAADLSAEFANQLNETTPPSAIVDAEPVNTPGQITTPGHNTASGIVVTPVSAITPGNMANQLAPATPPSGVDNSLANSLGHLDPTSPFGTASPGVPGSAFGAPYPVAMPFAPFAASQFAVMTPQASAAMYYQQHSPQPQFSPFALAPSVQPAYSYHNSWGNPPSYMSGGWVADAALGGQANPWNRIAGAGNGPNADAPGADHHQDGPDGEPSLVDK
ncbi:hypothetical protein ACHAQA_007666 [Verticillium albo-atrum]